MSHPHTPADDLVYDLVSIQYHALKGAQLVEQFRRDAEGHDDVIAFLDRIAAEDARRAIECHTLLRELTHDHGIAGDDAPAATSHGGWSGTPRGDGVGRTEAPEPADDGVAAGATSAQARAGDLTGGGTTNGISAYANGDGMDGGPTAEPADAAEANAASGAAVTPDDVDVRAARQKQGFGG